jgi:hypothetical protein
LRLGTRFETNLAGQDVIASVQEFEPMTRIAWGSYHQEWVESLAQAAEAEATKHTGGNYE